MALPLLPDTLPEEWFLPESLDSEEIASPRSTSPVARSPSGVYSNSSFQHEKERACIEPRSAS